MTPTRRSSSRHLPAKSLLTALACAIAVAAGPGEASAGGLLFVEYEAESDPPVNALRRAEDVAVSPDGTNLYAVDSMFDAIGVFARNPATGELTFLESHQGTPSSSIGLKGANGVAVSGDGGCVYATGEGEDALAVFGRDGLTGALTLLEVEQNGQGGVDALGEPQSVVVSPDGLHVYVGAREQMGSDSAIAIFGRTPPACDVSFLGSYTASNFRGEAVLALSPDGVYVYATGAFPSGIGVVHVLARNAVGGGLAFVELESDGVGGVDRLEAHLRDIAATSDRVHVLSSGGRALVSFARDAGTGEITFLEFQKDGGAVDGLDEPFALAVSPDEGFVYVAAGVSDDAVAVFRRDANGLLRFVEALKDPFIDPPNEVLPASARGIALSPGGDHLYATGKGATVFAVDTCGNGTVGVDEQCDDGSILGGDGCSTTCRLELCGVLPAAGCRGTAPLGASLRIKDLATDARDQLQLKWTRGEATTIAEFGDPLATASYALCVYDASASPQPLLAAAAPAGGACKRGQPCWKAGLASYRYGDALLTPDGLDLVQLKQGLLDGRAQLQVKGKGVNLFPPGAELPLPLALPVTVQVRNTETGVCWEAVFTAADRNDAEQFRARGN